MVYDHLYELKATADFINKTCILILGDSKLTIKVASYAVLNKCDSKFHMDVRIL